MRNFYLPNRNKEFWSFVFVFLLGLLIPSSGFLIPKFQGEGANLLMNLSNDVLNQIKLVDYHYDFPDIKKMKEYYAGNDLSVIPDFLFSSHYISVFEKISYDQAKEDVNFFLRILQLAYPGYFYFYLNTESGATISDKLYAGLDKLFLENQIISNTQLKSLLISTLQLYINDGHFFIDGESLLNPINYYVYNKEGIILKKDGNYYFQSNPDIRISLIDDKNPVRFLFPSFDINSGKRERIYYIGKLEQSDNSYFPVKIHLQEFQREWDEEILLVQSKNSNWIKPSNDNVYVRKKIQSIPYIKVLSFQDTFHSKLNRFIEDAYELRKEPVLIIDLRGNGGGSSYYAIQWINNFFGGTLPNYFEQMLEIENRTVFALKMNYCNRNNFPDKYLYYNNLLIDMTYGKIKRNVQVTESAEKYNGVKYKNNQLIFILQDKNTGSAAEAFIIMLKKYKNVFTIGTNTAGMLILPDPGEFLLPNAKLLITFGTKLLNYGFNYRLEGLGLLPDLWLYNNEFNDQEIEQLMHKIHSFFYF